MNKESLFQLIKKESAKLGLFILLLYLFFQIFYIKEGIFNVIKIIIAQAYLFIIPGFAVMLCFRHKISFIYRLLIGIGLGYSLNILIVYYVNIIIKVNIGKFYWIIPLLIISLGLILCYNSIRKIKE